MSKRAKPSRDRRSPLELILARDRKPAAIECVDALTEVFRHPRAHFAPYSDLEISRLLNQILESRAKRLLFEPRLSWECRREAFASMYYLFRDCFAVRCAPFLSHRNKVRGDPLNGVCYMWWELTFWPGPKHPERLQIADAELDVMARTLRLKSIVCQESALHGLGHLHLVVPDKVAACIASFLASRAAEGLSAELRDYAESAAEGCVP